MAVMLKGLARRWPLWLVAGAVLLVATLQPPERTEAHNCGATGSPAGPFDLQAYEAAKWKDTYARTMELAAHNKLLPDRAGFALPRVETGPRSAGSSKTTDPYVPPVVLKAIAWVESSWSMADWSVAHGEVGPPLVSHSCAYGIMQVLSGMQNSSGTPTLAQAATGSHYGFNIAKGARILVQKWNLAPEYRPQVGSRNPKIVEDWYYAIWSYHGFTFANHPRNSNYSSSRGVYKCDGTQSRSSFPYQELVLGCVANPPVVDGKPLWKAVSVHMPSLSQPAFSLSAWEDCSERQKCAGMDYPTPNPYHSDSKTPSVTRSQALGVPELSLSKGSITLVTIPPVVNDPASLTIANSGSGPLSWRAKSSASWLKVQRSQGVALGENLGYKASVVSVKAKPGGLAPGKYTAKLTIESLWSAGAPKTVSVTLYNYPDGTLLKGSGPAVYVIRSGLKRHIPNAATFEVRGYSWSDILTIPDSVLDGLPVGRPLLNVLADGNLVKGSGEAVYAMEAGAKRHVMSSSVMSACGYRWDAIYVLNDARLDGIAEGPGLSGRPCPELSLPNGALVKGETDPVYVARGGLLRHVPNGPTLEAQGYRWGETDPVPKGVLASIPRGDPLLDVLADGNLLTGSSHGVYVMEGGVKRHVTSRKVLEEDCGYGWDAVYEISDAHLKRIAKGTSLSGAPCPQFSPPGNALVKGSEPAVYVGRSGLKRHIPNPATLETQGLLWANLNVVPDSTLEAVPEGRALLNVLADGNLLRGTDDAVYVMEGGARRHVTGPDVMSACGYRWDAIYELSDSRLAGIAEGTPLEGTPCPRLSLADGLLLKDETAPVYVVRSGLRRHIPSGASLEAYGYHWGEIDRVPSGVLAYLTAGHPLLDVLADGNLLTGSGPAVYVMEGGAKRHITSRDVLEECGYGWDAVYLISDAQLERIAKGTSLSGPPCPHLSPPTGTLLKGSTDAIYVMKDGSRLHIASSEVFNSCGYLWGNVNTIPDSSLSNIPEGPSLTGPPCP